jgi:tRNA 2-selenouridine synthase
MNNTDIIKNATPLIDLRSPIEFEKGALISSVNIPILDNDERAQVGIEFKLSGQEKAVDLGYRLLKHKKNSIVDKWKQFILNNPTSYIYCMRGGLRSKIAQSWLKEIGINIPTIQSGYKSLRNTSINILDSVRNDKKKWIILAGRTGTGKTTILNNLECSIDLEKIAQHRGSAFGSLETPQPTMINFENILAYEYISHNNKTLLLEDESARIGRVLIPNAWQERMKKSPIILLNAPLEKRINNIFKEYIHLPLNNGLSTNKLRDKLQSSLFNIHKRLGLNLYTNIKAKINEAFSKSNEDYHKVWINSLLENYYDPMYDYQLKQKMDRCILNAQELEIKKSIKSLL